VSRETDCRIIRFRSVIVERNIRREPCVMVRETDAALAYQIIFLLNQRERCELVRATSPEMARKEIERKNETAIVTAILPVCREMRWRAVGSKQRR
jgi:hypothetical protein